MRESGVHLQEPLVQRHWLRLRIGPNAAGKLQLQASHQRISAVWRCVERNLVLVVVEAKEALILANMSTRQQATIDYFLRLVRENQILR